jgi:hypothetical protein
VNVTPLRRDRWWPLVIVLIGVATALILVALDAFRRGAVVLGASVLLAAFLRLLLPEDQAGWLAVRSRRVDVAVLGVLGLAITIVAFIVPAPN